MKKDTKEVKEFNPTKYSIDKTNYIISNMIGKSFHNHYHILYDIANYIGENNLTYMEIGTFAGGSASLMSLNENISKIISVDLGYPIEETTPIKNVNLFKHQNCTYEYIKGNSRKIETINLVKEKVKDVDILFIDGDHSFQGVVDDFENYKFLVKNGGYIVFDDYMDEIHSPQVFSAVNQIVSDLNPKEYEIIGSINYDLIKETNRPNLKSSNEFIIKKLF
jgi:predicted O-methyltransferase YrrM